MSAEDRRKEDNNGDWDEYRLFVIEEMKRQGIVQITIVQSIEEIKGRLIAQEMKMRNVSGIIAFAVSSVISLISGIIIFIIERHKG